MTTINNGFNMLEINNGGNALTYNSDNPYISLEQLCLKILDFWCNQVGNNTTNKNKSELLSMFRLIINSIYISNMSNKITELQTAANGHARRRIINNNTSRLKNANVQATLVENIGSIVRDDSQNIATYFNNNIKVYSNIIAVNKYQAAIDYLNSIIIQFDIIKSMFKAVHVLGTQENFVIEDGLFDIGAYPELITINLEEKYEDFDAKNTVLIDVLKTKINDIILELIRHIEAKSNFDKNSDAAKSWLLSIGSYSIFIPGKPVNSVSPQSTKPNVTIDLTHTIDTRTQLLEKCKNFFTPEKLTSAMNSLEYLKGNRQSLEALCSSSSNNSINTVKSLYEDFSKEYNKMCGKYVKNGLNKTISVSNMFSEINLLCEKYILFIEGLLKYYTFK